jgi:DNA gyrase subunit A
MVCSQTDQIFAIASNGVVIRTKVDEIRASSRDTMGVRMMRLGDDTTVVAVAKGAEDDDDDDEEITGGEEVGEGTQLTNITEAADETDAAKDQVTE